MSADQPSPETSAASTAPAPPVQEEDTTLLAFVGALAGLFPIEFIRETFRITPKGLFVEASRIDQLVVAFQSWWEKHTGGEVTRTLQKSKKRLFQTDDPELRHLSEGKVNLAGFVAPFLIREPQKYRLPFFLGSLAETRSTLHPKDPVFSELPGVEPVPTPQGLEVRVTVGDKRLTVTQQALKEFAACAEQSPRTMREFPKLTTALPEALRAFAAVIGKSRPQRKESTLLLPERYVDAKRYNYRTLGSYVFVFDKRDSLQQTIDLKGKSLYYLVRKEMANLLARGTKRIGCFELFTDRNHHLGVFHLPRVQARLAPRALVSFVDALADSPDKRDHFPANFTIKAAFERFSTVYQTAQPIKPQLISSYINRERSRNIEYLINNSWIFGVARDGSIELCIAKHLGIRQGPPEKSKRGNRPRGPRT